MGIVQKRLDLVARLKRQGLPEHARSFFVATRAQHGSPLFGKLGHAIAEIPSRLFGGDFFPQPVHGGQGFPILGRYRQRLTDNRHGLVELTVRLELGGSAPVSR